MGLCGKSPGISAIVERAAKRMELWTTNSVTYKVSGRLEHSQEKDTTAAKVRVRRLLELQKYSPNNGCLEDKRSMPHPSAQCAAHVREHGSTYTVRMTVAAKFPLMTCTRRIITARACIGIEIVYGDARRARFPRSACALSIYADILCGFPTDSTRYAAISARFCSPSAWRWKWDANSEAVIGTGEAMPARGMRPLGSVTSTIHHVSMKSC